MTADRETVRALRSLFEDDVTVLPDRVFDAVLGELPVTRQEPVTVVAVGVRGRTPLTDTQTGDGNCTGRMADARRPDTRDAVAEPRWLSAAGRPHRPAVRHRPDPHRRHPGRGHDPASRQRPALYGDVRRPQHVLHDPLDTELPEPRQRPGGSRSSADRQREARPRMGVGAQRPELRGPVGHLLDLCGRLDAGRCQRPGLPGPGIRPVLILARHLA